MRKEVDICFNKLTEFVSNPAYQQELEMAKQGFFKQIGSPQNGEPLLEMRLISFLEWFLFNRRLDGTRLTPAESYLEQQGQGMEESDKEILQGFTKTLPSLFKVIKTGEQGVVKDLYTTKKYKKVLNMASSLSKADIVEIRLMPLQGSYIMTEAICFHPPAAHKFLLGEMKRARKNGDDLQLLLRRFMGMSTKWERYPRMRVKQIYKND